MRLLADLNIAPRTVSFLRSLGHDVQRVGDVLAPSATDYEIVEYARRDGRSVVTQDLDFSAIVALSGQAAPSLICLRLASSTWRSLPISSSFTRGGSAASGTGASQPRRSAPSRGRSD